MNEEDDEIWKSSETLPTTTNNDDDDDDDDERGNYCSNEELESQPLFSSILLDNLGENKTTSVNEEVRNFKIVFSMCSVADTPGGSLNLVESNRSETQIGLNSFWSLRKLHIVVTLLR